MDFFIFFVVVQNKEGTSGAKQPTYVTSFLAAIVENLQLVVTNVHIRYEDSVTVPGRTFAAGAVIDKLSAQSANADWVRTLVEMSWACHCMQLCVCHSLCTAYRHYHYVDLLDHLCHSTHHVIFLFWLWLLGFTTHSLSACTGMRLCACFRKQIAIARAI